MTKKPATTRQTKTPSQRAQERYGVAFRAVEKLEKKRAEAQAELDAITPELDHAKARLDYIAGDPDLPANHTEPLPGVGETA